MALQVTFGGRCVVGVKVNVVAPPGGAGETLNVTGVPTGHWMPNAEAVMLTALLKVNDSALV